MEQSKTFNLSCQGSNSSMLGFMARQDMPHHLALLFRANPPLDYAPLPKKCDYRQYGGFYDNFRDYMGMFEEGAPPKREVAETKDQVREKEFKQKMKNHLEEQHAQIKEWNPKADPNIKGDPYKTIIITGLSFHTDERSLKREFSSFGHIRNLRVIINKKTGKSRGYAFIEYERESDCEEAYKKGRNRKVDGRYVTVDIERGRTKRDWLPRRLGGGKGDTRRDREIEKILKEIKEENPHLKDVERPKEVTAKPIESKEEGKKEERNSRSRSNKKKKSHKDKKDKKDKRRRHSSEGSRKGKEVPVAPVDEIVVPATEEVRKSSGGPEEDGEIREEGEK